LVFYIYDGVDSSSDVLGQAGLMFGVAQLRACFALSRQGLAKQGHHVDVLALANQVRELVDSLREQLQVARQKPGLNRHAHNLFF
jgi:proteasome assembly chaperone (PAC2) family protein